MAGILNMREMAIYIAKGDILLNILHPRKTMTTTYKESDFNWEKSIDFKLPCLRTVEKQMSVAYITQYLVFYCF